MWHADPVSHCRSFVGKPNVNGIRWAIPRDLTIQRGEANILSDCSFFGGALHSLPKDGRRE
jgi:hypothetical protein